MNWHLVADATHEQATAHAAAVCGGTLVLRGLTDVAGWSWAGGDAPLWHIELPGDALMGVKALVALDDLAVTLVDPADNQTALTVVAVDGRQGRERWRSRLPLVPSRGGLLAVGGALFVHGRHLHREQYMLCRVDGATGKSLWAKESVQLRFAAAVGDPIVIADWDGMHCFDPDGERLDTIPAASPTLAASDESLVAQFYDAADQATFGWWQQPVGQPGALAVVEGVPATASPEVLLAAGALPGTVAYATYEAGSGLWLVAVTEGRVLWSALADETLRLRQLLPIGEQLLALAQRDQTDEVWVVAQQAGDASRLPLDGAPLIALHWLDPYLLAAGYGRFQIFRREGNPEP